MWTAGSCPADCETVSIEGVHYVDPAVPGEAVRIDDALSHPAEGPIRRLCVAAWSLAGDSASAPVTTTLDLPPG
jgi:hypothetical protein